MSHLDQNEEAYYDKMLGDSHVTSLWLGKFHHCVIQRIMQSHQMLPEIRYFLTYRISFVLQSPRELQK